MSLVSYFSVYASSSSFPLFHFLSSGWVEGWQLIQFPIVVVVVANALN